MSFQLLFTMFQASISYPSRCMACERSSVPKGKLFDCWLWACWVVRWWSSFRFSLVRAWYFCFIYCCSEFKSLLNISSDGEFLFSSVAARNQQPRARGSAFSLLLNEFWSFPDWDWQFTWCFSSLTFHTLLYISDPTATAHTDHGWKCSWCSISIASDPGASQPRLFVGP